MNILYKVVSVRNWDRFVKSGSKKFYGFDNDITSGFIHLCTLKQMNEVIEKKYKKDNYVKLKIDANTVQGIKWELYPKNGVYYPHVCSIEKSEDPFIKVESIISIDYCLLERA